MSISYNNLINDFIETLFELIVSNDHNTMLEIIDIVDNIVYTFGKYFVSDLNEWVCIQLNSI